MGRTAWARSRPVFGPLARRSFFTVMQDYSAADLPPRSHTVVFPAADDADQSQDKIPGVMGARTPKQSIPHRPRLHVHPNPRYEDGRLAESAEGEAVVFLPGETRVTLGTGYMHLRHLSVTGRVPRAPCVLDLSGRAADRARDAMSTHLQPLTHADAYPRAVHADLGSADACPVAEAAHGHAPWPRSTSVGLFSVFPRIPDQVIRRLRSPFFLQPCILSLAGTGPVARLPIRCKTESPHGFPPVGDAPTATSDL